MLDVDFNIRYKSERSKIKRVHEQIFICTFFFLKVEAKTTIVLRINNNVELL